MIISTALKTAGARLTQANISSAPLDAELLLSFVLQKPREYLLAHGEDTLTDEQQHAFTALIAKRAQHIPIAYLTHEAFFYGRSFYIDERVLVPRPETEQIINELKMINDEYTDQPTAIIDIGTGSGCLIVTATKELKQKFDFFAGDTSEAALAVARKNAYLHRVDKKITFFQGNLLEPLMYNNVFSIHYSSFIILANLPYLDSDMKNLLTSADSKALRYEPRLALDGGRDGLDLYRKLAQQVKQWYHCEKRSASEVTRQSHQSSSNITLLCEIGEEQGAAMREIFSLAKKTAIKKDLAERERIAVIQL